MGKGSKERMVPLGEEAQHWLERYLAQSRPQLANKRALAPLFLEMDWRGAHARPFWRLVKQYAVVAGHRSRAASARTGCATASPRTC
jgi:integrase/recombinase XerD